MTLPARKPFRLKHTEPSEAVVLYDVLACLKQLQALGKVVWYARFNTASGRLQYGNSGASQWIKFAFKGCPDVLGQLPGGKLLCIEVKSPSGKVTEDQAAFIEMAGHNGALAFVARSVSDVLQMLEEHHRP